MWPGASIAWLIMAMVLVTAGCTIFKSSPDSSTELRDRVVEAAAADKDPDRARGNAADRRADSQDIATETPGKNQVRLDGSLLLGDTDNLAFTPEQLTTALQGLLDADRPNSARSLVATYPDLVAKLLLSPASLGMPRSHLATVIDLYRDQWGQAPEAFNELQAAHRRGTAKKALEAQARFLDHLQHSQVDQALKMGLSRSTEPAGSLLLAESLRLEAMAHLMNEDYNACNRRLRQAVELLKTSQPLEADRMNLLLAESERRAGNHETWKEVWADAVLSHGRRLEYDRLRDPSFWKQAAFQRPLKEAWPDSLIAGMRRYLQDDGLEFDAAETPESVVWASIGSQCLRRHESQNAVLSFKKAEATVVDFQLKKELQMQQAVAMIAGGQPGPASATLLRISSDEGVLADRAQAVLASMKLQNGSLAQGMNLLQSAIETSAQWPTHERLRAQADFALAYLMRGKERQGVDLLNRLSEQFLYHDDFAQAAQCLDNLATYYQKTEQTEKYRDTVQRREQLESS